MIALLVAVLVSSLAGSLHCAAMCGPLAGLAGTADPGAPRWIPHLAYGLGRLFAYLVLGVIAGAIGAAVDLAARMASIGEIAMVFAGLAMVGWGARTLILASRPGGAGNARPMLYAIRRRRPVLRGALVGLLTAALPCGWLYAFVVVAAGTASPLGGAMVMATFWLGSTPALVGAGLTLRALGRRLGSRLPLVTAGLQIALGLVALGLRAPMFGVAPRAAASTSVPMEHSCH